MSESKDPMIRFSIIVFVLLLISLPLKLSYFKNGTTAESEVLARQVLTDDIAAYLVSLGYNVKPTSDDPFLPTAELYKDACVIRITPLPVIRDLDNSFVFVNAEFDGQLAYYYDGGLFVEAPINTPRFWEYAARALPKIGITIRERIRLGLAYSDACDLVGLRFEPLNLE
jgi:hypothetical protein